MLLVGQWQSIRISSTYLDTGKPYNDLYVVADFPETFGVPEILDVQCKSKGTGPVACRMLLSSDNAALILMQQGEFFFSSTLNERIDNDSTFIIAGKTKWVREEALANIVAIEMIDLPLADFEGSIESELQNKDGKSNGLHYSNYIDDKLSKIISFNLHDIFKRKVTSIVSVVVFC